mgnify:CR=1 FL=1
MCPESVIWGRMAVEGYRVRYFNKAIYISSSVTTSSLSTIKNHSVLACLTPKLIALCLPPCTCFKRIDGEILVEKNSYRDLFNLEAYKINASGDMAEIWKTQRYPSTAMRPQITLSGHIYSPS